MESVTGIARIQIEKFMTELNDFYEGWFNATIPKTELHRFADKLHPKWKLVNNQTPMIVSDKDNFLKVWPTFHGRFKDKKVKQNFEIKSMEKLSEDYYLVVYIENTEMENGIHSRPITTLLKKEGVSFLICHVHES